MLGTDLHESYNMPMQPEHTKRVPKTIRTFFKLILVLFFLFIILNFFFYRMYRSDAKLIISEKDIQRSNSLANTVNFIFSEVERTTELLISTSLFSETLLNRNTDQPLDYDIDTQILGFLNNLSRTADSIESVLLYDKRTHLFYSTGFGVLRAEELVSASVFTAAAGAVRTPVWRQFPELPQNPYTGNPNHSLGYVMSLSAPDSMETVGFIAIYLNQAVLERIFSNTTEEWSRIIDAQLVPIYPQTGKLPAYSMPEQLTDYGTLVHSTLPIKFNLQKGSQYTSYVVNSLSAADWFLLNSSTINLSKTYMSRSGRIIIFILILNTLIFGLFITGYTKQALKPVRQLTAVMQRVSDGDFSVQISHRRRDEYGYIFNQFNRMVAEIQHLFNQVYKEQLLQKELKLVLLRTKINPHFIYNIIENMKWMIELGRYEELQHTLMATSVYYRRAFKDDREEVSFGEALDQISEYIQLQQIRFRNRLKLQLNVPEETKQLVIPNFCLQPIVENAVIHGIENKPGGGTIEITAERLQNKLLCRITDDGPGMESGQLQALRESLAEAHQETNGALLTIHQRLQLLYGQDGGIEIDRSNSGGLCVTVHFLFENDV